MIIFSIYIALFVRFNTPGVRVNIDFRNFIYAAPIVLAVLLTILVLLCQPPKEKKEEENKENTEETPEENSQPEEKA
jgi:hypothetical protein